MSIINMIVSALWPNKDHSQIRREVTAYYVDQKYYTKVNVHVDNEREVGRLRTFAGGFNCTVTSVDTNCLLHGRIEDVGAVLELIVLSKMSFRVQTLDRQSSTQSGK